MTNHEKVSSRLATILMWLNEGKKFSIDELREEFGVSKRTIQRDLFERFSFLPLKKENGYYFLEEFYLGKFSFDDIKNFSILSGIKELYPTLSEEFLKKILDNNAQTYMIKGNYFENISHKTPEFEKLSKAIEDKKIIKFIYNDKERVVKPYKLVNSRLIWYLMAKEEKLKTFTFSKIHFLQVSDETFEVDKKILEEIENSDDIFFSKDKKEIILHINKKIAPYFKRRKLVPYQEIIKETADSILVSTKISYDEMILKIVRYWLPNIKIISPAYLQEKLENSLREYLKG